jgi:hypothetical protein
LEAAAIPGGVLSGQVADLLPFDLDSNRVRVVRVVWFGHQHSDDVKAHTVSAARCAQTPKRILVMRFPNDLQLGLSGTDVDPLVAWVSLFAGGVRASEQSAEVSHSPILTGCDTLRAVPGYFVAIALELSVKASVKQGMVVDARRCPARLCRAGPASRLSAQVGKGGGGPNLYTALLATDAP